MVLSQFGIEGKVCDQLNLFQASWRVDVVLNCPLNPIETAPDKDLNMLPHRL